MSEAELSTGLELPEAPGQNPFPAACRPGVRRSRVILFLALPAPGRFLVYPSSLPSLFSGCPATMVPSQCPPPIQAVLWGAWRPCPCQDTLRGVSHGEEVTPSLRNAGLMRDSSFSGFGEQRPRVSVSLGEISVALPWGQGQGFGVSWLFL